MTTQTSGGVPEDRSGRWHAVTVVTLAWPYSSAALTGHMLPVAAVYLWALGALVVSAVLMLARLGLGVAVGLPDGELASLSRSTGAAAVGSTAAVDSTAEQKGPPSLGRHGRASAVQETPPVGGVEPPTFHGTGPRLMR